MQTASNNMSHNHIQYKDEFQQFCDTLHILINKTFLFSSSNYNNRVRAVNKVFEYCISNIKNNIFSNVSASFRKLSLPNIFITKAQDFITQIEQKEEWVCNISPALKNKLMKNSHELINLSIEIIRCNFKIKPDDYNDASVRQKILRAKSTYMLYIRKNKGLRSYKPPVLPPKNTHTKRLIN